MTMKKKKLGKSLPGGLKAARRKMVDLSSSRLVKHEPLSSQTPLPLLIRPAVEGVKLSEWCASNRDFLNMKLREHGGVLFRGFLTDSVAEFEKLVEVISGDLLRYTYRSTPRSEVEGKIYTSTEYPADQAIPLHNEMSYSRSWPMKICFYCVKKAEAGGETPIADSHKVYDRIAPETRKKFKGQGVLYVRNYGGALDLSWQEVFQPSEKGAVEAFCRGAGIECEWRDNDRLRTRQRCQAVATHPVTGAALWFNQAHLFHVSSLRDDLRGALLSAMPEEDLPRNAYYGDGSEIEAETLHEIRQAYEHETVIFPWQEGDLLLLDNMLTAHGRTSFEGARKVLVGMGEAAGESPS